ncbi:hypothetical protein, partial [Sulfitobacter sp.]|uniref:hypothetical protein n=1 Tax=Sulfitobacter sp. TaxID=1903071 RepID=UPI0040585ABE
VLPALPVSVPTSPNPPINKGIESAIDPSIKQEFFNKISPKCEFDFLAACTRSEKNAAKAKNLIPSHSGRSSHSCRALHGLRLEILAHGRV